MMFPTTIGAMRGGREAFMRPETAQGMFMLYPSLYRHFKQKLPFGALQTGRGYRNEISPRQGMIRLREFNMAELEYFIDPEDPPEVDLGGWKNPVSLVPDPEGGFSGSRVATFSDALDEGIIKHPTVAWFLARTWDFLVSIGIDSSKVRFRQHTGTEMAHYASDCWDCEILGEYGWVECVGIANRTCHDLESHEEHSGTNLLRAWRQYSEPILVKKDVLSPNGSVIGPIFKGRSSDVSDALSEMQEIPDKIPFSLDISDGTSVEITPDMVTRRTDEVNVHGEWFTPHVVEPAFGIDRIIWHVIDHAFNESGKSGEQYTILSLDEKVTPFDVSVLPLFDKEGMGEIARKLASEINSIPGIRADIDTSRSIGRRYARADEIGVPWAITVDHSTIDDDTVTIRRRDNQMQIRVPIKIAIDGLRTRSLDSMF